MKGSAAQSVLPDIPLSSPKTSFSRLYWIRLVHGLRALANCLPSNFALGLIVNLCNASALEYIHAFLTDLPFCPWAAVFLLAFLAAATFLVFLFAVAAAFLASSFTVAAASRFFNVFRILDSLSGRALAEVQRMVGTM